MKKRWKILLVCVVVVAAVAAIAAGICTRYVLHYPAVGEDYQIHIVEVGEGLADVTDQVDLEALGSLLQTQNAWAIIGEEIPFGWESVMC